MTDPLPLGEPRVHLLGRRGSPTLVLLHGLSDSGLCWPDAVRRWHHTFRIIAPDARGHGRSPRFDPATSGSNRFEDMVADVVALLEALADEGGQPPLLVGHSMGAGVAGAVLSARPDLVCAGVLEDPSWYTGSWPRDRLYTTQQNVQPFRDDLEAALARGRAEHPLWPEIELRPWAVSKARLDPSLKDRDQIASPRPWVQDAAGITVPALVITGTREGAVIVTAQSRHRLADLGNPLIEIRVVPGAGHTVRRDSPALYHQIVDPWITEHVAAAAG